MNGSGEKRYSAKWEKLSKKLRLQYHCAICGETSYKKKEVHHIDNNKKNDDINNLLVVCTKCHLDIHKKNISLPEVKYKNKSGISVTVAHFTSSKEDWFDSKLPLKILPNLPPKIANAFRKEYIKGFVNIGGCNYYVGLSYNNVLIGVLGFSVPEMGGYSLLLKADTTPSQLKYSTDLLLYVLRTKQIKDLLEKKFSRKIQTVYSYCFSRHERINRYRKHAKLEKSKKVDGGFNCGYTFEMGTVHSLKEAISIWRQKNKL